MPDKRYPIAEIFDSVQGEGLWTGTAMTFIRLAGCHIGGARARCCFADGREFACDTDYRSKQLATAQQIAARASHHHVCITGGEPLDHELAPLLAELARHDHHIHLETSGTIEAPAGIHFITVSPKRGCLDSMLKRADQIKLLIDERFSHEAWTERLRSLDAKALVYVQPLNARAQLDPHNARRSFELTQRIPAWRLSLQLHKVLGVR